MSKSLNDDQVLQEMNKMVAFIKQEALEKAREIKIKADEEFQLEKGKLVRQESSQIEAFFQKKLKAFEIACKIKASHGVNADRLKILELRNSLMSELVATTRQKLSAVANSSDAAYSRLLSDLLIQGFYKLMERNVVVQCRPQDAALITSLLPSIIEQYKKNVNLPLEPVIDSTAPLNPDCGGGVIVSCFDGKIRVDNTLAARLDIISEGMLPEIKEKLFGPNPNRKFFT